ncbi:type II toxin-antitoxin system CcdA family antitoxin [Nodosilinea sp. LEGE 07088]|uniref:type II toxin-antitoxin system CcdA family antitoxin n=1 Tax=Nodosilinea sp. LEGE 07088 TaxID=2777968 RepID=UPI00187E6BB7|nr:type II toxin-antitoxin system CcdA family antitoxin [Nodosilinea sp. LEGE 07088]MBE9139537.1 type II toxin-antitoxin system CcdA family antitoxin [Nodosilinea sp. LEGE 07088]
MQNPTSPTDERSAEKIDLSVQIDKDLLDQVTHLSANPSKVIEVALRQWLRGDRRYEDDLVRHLPRNPTVPPKGEWND